MALPCPLHAVSQRTLVINASPTNYNIFHNFNCHINKRETPKTCLINHKSYILLHITPIVINSLRGEHTHTYRHYRQKQFQETSCMPAGGLKDTDGISQFCVVLISLDRSMYCSMIIMLRLMYCWLRMLTLSDHTKL